MENMLLNCEEALRMLKGDDKSRIDIGGGMEV